MELISRLRAELAHDRHPERHVFRLTRAQERQIIDYLAGLSFIPAPRIEHLVGMFGCPVQVVGGSAEMTSLHDRVR